MMCPPGSTPCMRTLNSSWCSQSPQQQVSVTTLMISMLLSGIGRRRRNKNFGKLDIVVSPFISFTHHDSCLQMIDQILILSFRRPTRRPTTTATPTWISSPTRGPRSTPPRPSRDPTPCSPTRRRATSSPVRNILGQKFWLV